MAGLKLLIFRRKLTWWRSLISTPARRGTRTSSRWQWGGPTTRTRARALTGQVGTTSVREGKFLISSFRLLDYWGGLHPERPWGRPPSLSSQQRNIKIYKIFTKLHYVAFLSVVNLINSWNVDQPFNYYFNIRKTVGLFACELTIQNIKTLNF